MPACIWYIKYPNPLITIRYHVNVFIISRYFQFKKLLANCTTIEESTQTY